MKVVLTSIQPYYVFLIIARAMGWKVEQGKTVEIRKNFPQAGDWNKKSLIYCSQNRRSFKRIPAKYQPLMARILGKIVGEFFCDEIFTLFPWGARLGVTDKTDTLVDPKRFCKMVCLTEKEVCDYIGIELGEGYGWHISDLKIYDKPKALSEFFKPCPFPSEDCDLMCPYAIGEYHGDGISGDCEFVGCDNKIIRPPQSWMYVEEV